MKLTHEMCDEIFAGYSIDVKRWITLIVAELNGAKEKHPSWPKDFIHASAIVAEESGELVRAALQFAYEKGRYYDMHTEAVHTGAMALRFLINASELEHIK